MKTRYFVWIPGIDDHVAVSRAEYRRLRTRAMSRSIGYEESVDSMPDITLRFLYFPRPGSSGNTGTPAGLTIGTNPAWPPGTSSLAASPS